VFTPLPPTKIAYTCILYKCSSTSPNLCNRWCCAPFIFGNQTVPAPGYDAWVLSADTDTGALGWFQWFPSTAYSEGYGVAIGLDSQPIATGEFKTDM
jgi:hypothetical protein